MFGDDRQQVAEQVALGVGQLRGELIDGRRVGGSVGGADACVAT
ncbi:MAG: hypothetical protein ABI726_01315 [bacterium]